MGFLIGTSAFAANAAQESELQKPIPDENAYRMIFLVASNDMGATDMEVKRANAVIQNIALTDDDHARFATIVAEYRTNLRNIDAEINSAGTAPKSGTLADLYLRKQHLLGATMLQAETQLSAAGAKKLAAYVNREKAHMKLFDIPEMPGHDNGLLGSITSLFSLPTVHAQGMHPTGTYYTNLSVDNADNAYATGVTDATSTCHCHTSEVAVTLVSFDGRSSQTGTQGVEVAQATTGLSFDDTLGQFGNGTIEGQSRHNAYCPIINQWFIQNAQSVAQATSANIQAYY